MFSHDSQDSISAHYKALLEPQARPYLAMSFSCKHRGLNVFFNRLRQVLIANMRPRTPLRGSGLLMLSFEERVHR